MGWRDWLNNIGASVATFEDLPETGRHSNRERVSLLEQFMGELHIGSSLMVDDARERIDQSLIELHVMGQHSSNGLLITDDGYFLTAYHCVEDSARKGGPLMIRTNEGKFHGIEEVCYAWPRADLALAKANIRAESKPIHLPFFEGTPAQLVGSPVSVLSRWEGEICRAMAEVERSSYLTLLDHNGSKAEALVEPKDHIALSYTDSIPGDSGGIVVSSHGRVAGILVGGGIPTPNKMGVMVKSFSGSGVSINMAYGMLLEYIGSLRE